MSDFLEILKYVIPSLVVFFTSFFLIRSFFKAEERRKMLEIKATLHKDVLPLKLQAYERLTIFLERISPASLILRVHKNGMSARYLQNELVNTIKSEFEHNLSQQIYVSNTCWEVIKNAKEEMIKFVLTAGSKLDESSGGVDFSRLLLEIAGSVEKLPTSIALDVLKAELRQTQLV